MNSLLYKLTGRRTFLIVAVAGVFFSGSGSVFAQVDPNAPWRSAEGKAAIQAWMDLATRRLNSSDLGRDYNERKAWWFNQYGLLMGQGIRSNYEPDLWPRYEGREHWVWAHYSRNTYSGAWDGSLSFWNRANPGIPSVKEFVHAELARIPRPAADPAARLIEGKHQALATALGPSSMNIHGEAAASPRGTTGRYQHFRHGYILWHRNGAYAGQVFATYGDIAYRYSQEGGSSGWLGFPVSDEFSVSGGRRSNFEGGYITWDARTRETRVYRW